MTHTTSIQDLRSCIATTEITAIFLAIVTQSLF